VSPSDFENSIRNTYTISKVDGYHIATSFPPYHLGDVSLIGQEPGLITIIQDILVKMIWYITMRAPILFLSKEVYTRVFQKYGFHVEEEGYFSTNEETKPREFSYIIAKKTPISEETYSGFDTYY
jgi:hypothetical protein